ncbi:glycoside hydrolase [Lactifluus subvellereus]|nr:glycoside hydrolase [Lactifluus subvellereus]
MWWIFAPLLSLAVEVALAAHPQCRLVAPPAHVRNGPPASSVKPQSTKGHSPSTATSAAPTAAATPFVPFPYYSKPIRGVNLGGWFVLEPWITPSMFSNTNNDAIVDEYTFGQLQDPNTALAALKQHWDTWITEDDFIEMAAAGLTHIRLPIGYWSVPTNVSVAPYVPGAWPYIQRAVGWARQHNIHTIVDLHGVPGSQNGFDNSGQRTNAPQWALNTANVDASLAVIQVIATELGPQVDAIELLNEIGGFYGPVWDATARTYYQNGYNTVRQAAGNDIVVVIGDAFDALPRWQGFLSYPQANRVMMDVHRYQIFSVGELTRSHDQHIQFACQSILPDLQAFASKNIWTVSGEWSTSITDCAQWLNGRGTGSRWEGTFGGGAAVGSCAGYTGNWSTFSQDYRAFLRKYWEAQVEVGEAVQGWIYWTWKTEGADEWSYKKGLEGGWIPQDPSQRLYPGLCQGTTK